MQSRTSTSTSRSPSPDRTPGPARRFGPATSAERQLEDLFLTRSADLAFHRTRTSFDLARSVFSSAAVDAGSQLLLRHLQALRPDGVKRVLDIGCGHGTLGIVLKALDPSRAVTFVDRDALACRFTVRNLVANGFADDAVPGPDGMRADRVVGGLGCADLDDETSFDLVVSNLPGKAGEDVIRHLVHSSATAATPGGLVGFVIVDPLAGLLADAVAAAGLVVELDKGNRSHRVIIGRVPDTPIEGPATPTGHGFADGIYDRTTTRFRASTMAWEGTTVAGIDEFDSLGQATKLLRTALQGVRSTPALIVNPGQGHRAVVAALAGYPPRRLLSRDRLALVAAHRMLAAAGIPAADGEDPALLHGIGLSADALDGVGLTVFHLDPKAHHPWVTDQLDRYLVMVGEGQQPADGPANLVLTGRSGLLGRLESDLLSRRRCRIAYKNTVKGHRVLRIEMPPPAGRRPRQKPGS